MTSRRISRSTAVLFLEFVPGQPTAQYIDYVLSRITLGGAVYISAICVLPTFFTQAMKVPFYFGGTSVLILGGRRAGYGCSD